GGGSRRSVDDLPGSRRTHRSGDSRAHVATHARRKRTLDAPSRDRDLVTNAVTTHSEAETAALGRRVAESLTAGAVVLLSGDLGTGKTAFVRGLAEGLGIAGADVNSPTFTLM